MLDEVHGYWMRRKGEPTVMLVGEAPGRQEIIEGEPFVGDSGQLLRTALKKAKVPGRIYLTNVCRERVKPTAEHIKKWMPKLEEEILQVNPDVIGAVGKVALKALTGETSITKALGRIMKIGKYTVVPMLHPAAVLHSDGRSLEDFALGVVRLQAAATGEWGTERMPVEYLTDLGEIEDMLKCAKEAGAIALDVETNGLDPVALGMTGGDGARIEVVGIAFGGRGYAFDFHRSPHRPKLHRWLCRLMEFPPSGFEPLVVCAHRASFEVSWLEAVLGIDATALDWRDSKLDAHLYDENLPNDLSTLAWRFTPWGGYDAEVADLVAHGTMHWQIPSEKLAPYCAGDALCSWHLHSTFWNEEFTPKQRALALDVLYPMEVVLGRIRQRGLHVSRSRIAAATHQLRDEANTFVRNMEKSKYWGAIQKVTAAKEFKLKSTLQIRALVKHLGLKPIKFTDTGQVSTEAMCLDVWADRQPLMAELRDARSADAMISGFLVPFDERARADDTICTDYTYGTVVTGRLSSRSPNLQNMKREGPVRKCFTSRFKNGLIVEMDWSQLEVRLCGVLSGEKRLLEAAREGDMHLTMGAIIYNKALEDVTSEERYEGKRVIFGILYGQTAGGLARNLNKTTDYARSLIRRLLDGVPTYRRWRKTQRDKMTQLGYAEAITGRRRHLSRLQDRDAKLVDEAVGQGLNFLVQSAAADIVHNTAYWLEVEMRRCLCESILVAEIHDSLVVDATKKEVTLVIDLMQQAAAGVVRAFDWLPFPLPIDIKYGRSLGQLESIGEEDDGEN